jgi:hypothetical protein
MRVVFALTLMLAAVGCESPIVGGKCQVGFTICRDACVNLQRDFTNCGKCGNLCGDFLCLKGKCEPREQPDAASSEDAAKSD